MTFKKLISAGLLALAAAVFVADPAFAQAATVNKGDTTWMMVATIVVLVMTVPGLALFYGGLVRSKNMLSMLMQIGYTVCIVILIWVIYGYSLAFTGGSEFIGGFTKAFLSGVTAESLGGTFTDRVAIPELVFVMFQATFAAITASLLLGSVAERMKFAAVAVFIPLWVTFVYFPMAHMVWYWAGPDATVDAVKALAAAAPDAKAKAQEALDALGADAGFIFKLGAIDFAGGTVVHINSGIAGLVGAIIVGKRLGYGKELMPPHSLVMTYIGAMLLWFGWFGFNAGSNLEAAGSAIVAFVNTFVATAAAAFSWVIAEWLTKGKPSLLGLVSGIVAGLVAVTPAAGFGGAMGVLVLGLVAGVVCYFFCTVVKNIFKYDDALDVFGIHAVGGIVGAIGTGIVVAPYLGGTGIFDYTINKVADYDMATQVLAQIKGVLVTIVWSGIGSAILFYIVKFTIGLRPTPDQEREGLDITDHGERAYN
ncbi:MAG: ammonium transporter [Xanthobacteraceae bacterium]|nr:ammonium transporter [Xanthobacteraceae bacterium]QYK44970.1 MAG: ammonium transporter [Xanthobacteraceae bacterium]